MNETGRPSVRRVMTILRRLAAWLRPAPTATVSDAIPVLRDYPFPPRYR
jgi:hypothetical protein